MKLDELHLIAFGPFTDLKLDLSGGRQGLHVIYGPNEAGKSSTLRALIDLLYEIPRTTADAFLHPYSRLRIGAVIRPADGEPLQVVRRKGSKGTLLSAETDEPIDEAELTALLQGVDREFFTSFFGIDQPTLVRGGEQILAQGGDLGQALFSAALPTGDLRATLAELDTEAGELYKRNASKPTINRAISEHKAARRELKEASLAGNVWLSHHRALSEANEELERLGQELTELMALRNRLVRLSRVLPLLSARSELLIRREALRRQTLLPAGFAAERREAQQTRRDALEACRRTEAKLARLRAEARALDVPERLLTEADSIEAFYQRLGSHLQARHDRPGLLDRAEQRRRDAAAGARTIAPELDLEAIEAMRPVIARQRSIQTLANQYQAIENAQVTAREALERADDQRRVTAEAVEELSADAREADVAGLRRVLAWVRRAGDLDQAIEQARHEASRSRETAEVNLRQLGLRDRPLDALESTAVPARESIERFEEREVELRERRRETDKSIEQVGRSLRTLERRLEELRGASGEIPSEEALLAARAARDRTWSTLCDQLEASPAPAEAAPTAELCQRLDAGLREADELADRLRREADRVQKHAALTAQREELLQERVVLEETARSQAEESAGHETSWRKLWAASEVEPMSPREMSSWLTRFDALRDRLGAVRKAEGRVTELREQRDERRQKLAVELEKLGEAVWAGGEQLGPVVTAAEELVARLERDAARREELARRLSQLEVERRRAEDELRRSELERERWRGQWGEVIVELGLDANAAPAEVEDVLATLTGVFTELDQAIELERRVAGIDRDAELFAAEVRGFAVELDPDLGEVDPERAILELHQRLKTARQASTAAAKLRGQINDRQEELTAAEAQIETARERLSDLMALAGVTEEEQLPEAERRSDQRRTAEQDLKRIEDQLLREGEGATIEALLDEAAEIDPDELPGRIQQLEHEVDQRQHRRDQLIEQKGRQEAELARMDGNARAAEVADRTQEIIATLRGEVERYLRLRLASTILRDQIERFRSENQSALLQRGGELLSRLTLGALTDLQTEYDDDDEPLLVGVRTDGTTLGVTAMSAGTRDQLYLALRLATLERYLTQTAEPLPFVVDDILINFDDDRSSATLEVLAELSELTQVVLFTHHRRVQDIAEALDRPRTIFVHRLGC